jgi:hypothetical protein
MKKLLGLLFFSALTFSLSGCAQAIGTWDGSGAVLQEVTGKANDPCEPSWSGNPRSGTSVTLRDSAGVVVSLSRLEGGTLANGDDTNKGRERWKSIEHCVFEFRFVDVESDDKFFSVEVGSHGVANAAREDLELALVVLLVDNYGLIQVPLDQ